jgi:hypothetical protein
MKYIIALSACALCLTMSAAHASEHYTRLSVQQLATSDVARDRPDSNADSLEALRQEKLEVMKQQAALQAALDALFELPDVQ